MSADSSTANVHYRACNLCEAICGLEITLEGGQVAGIKGDRADPFSRGHICPKAVALMDIQSDRDRLRGPVRRVGQGAHSQWISIGWDEAIDIVATRLVEIQASHGNDAIATYQGNPNVHDLGLMTHGNHFLGHLKTHNRFSATSTDQLPHQLVCFWMYGHQLMVPIPDIDQTSHMLMLGANPLASNGSMMTVPDVANRLKELKQRGGKLVVMDPRRTETALVADEHRFIRPGSYGRWKSRVRAMPEVNGELPVSIMAEEMLTPGEGQVRALITLAGNPALSTPNGPQLERALDGLEFMVSLDLYINETTRFADVILPSTTAPEHDHYDLIFNVLAVRNVARYSAPALPKPEGALHHSWLHNADRLVRGRDRTALLAHPADLARLGIRAGGRITMVSRTGQVQIEVQPTEDIMPGVVSLPHGWGHHREGIRMQIAAQHHGVSANDLTDDQVADAVSGNAALNGLAVTLEKSKLKESTLGLAQQP